MKLSRCYLGWGLLSLLVWSCPAATPVKPNIVFILADDLGWRDLGCFGSTYFKTPNLDALAKRGMIFTQAYAANPLCSPSRASIMTGQYPARIGMTAAVGHLPEVKLQETVQARASADQKSLSDSSVTRLSTNYVTLAETLKAAGYATGHFGKWHLGEEPFSPLQQGFDVDVPHWPGPGPAGSYVAPWKFPPQLHFAGQPGEHIEDRMASEAVKFIDANKDHPFFLNYWSFSVHAPYDAKPAYVKQAAMDMDEDLPQHNPVYAAMVHSLDDAVGTLVKALQANGLMDKTIIVFFSDNGGVNWQAMNGESARRGHDSVTAPYINIPPTSNHPLRGGKATIYEGGTREPCFVVWPGVVQPGGRSEAMIQGVDFYPTLAEITGARLPAGQAMDGRSFLPVLKGEATTHRDTIFNFFPHNVKATGQLPAVSVREGDWKLIRYFHDGPQQEDRFELYHLQDDLGESNNAAAAQPDRVKAMDKLISNFLHETKAVVPGPNPAYNPKATTPARGTDKPLKVAKKSAEISVADMEFIDNGVIRLGVKKTSGAGIAWLSLSGSSENLLDHWDHGRLIQQSYYGENDGSLWVKKPWSWNPVQGGDYQGHAAEVLELSSDKTSLRARIRPRNWAGGELLADCEMEETIRLEGAVAVVKFGFRYRGTKTHPVRHHEVPATFVNPAYGTMVTYNGNQPWTGGALTRSHPGWPNEPRKITEGWAAWVNDQNIGVGVFSPIAKELTCYRFGASPEAKGACSYFAPLVKFAITPGMHFEYEVALALGTPEEMRAEFLKRKRSLFSRLPTTEAK